MFRFTSKKVEDEKLKNLYQSHNIKIPEKGLYGEQYLKQCFNSNERSQQAQKPTVGSSKNKSKKFDIVRASSSEVGNRQKLKHSNTQIQNKGVENVDLNHSFLDKRINPKQQKSSGTYIFPNQQKQKSYYIIPSSKAGLMDIFEKYKDYTPKQQTQFKTQTSRVTPQRPIKHFKALSQNLSSTVCNSDKKQQNYYDYEIPQSILDMFAKKKLNQSTSFHNKTFHENSNIDCNTNNNNNNSFAHSSPQQEMNTMNNSFLAEKNKQITSISSHLVYMTKDNIFATKTYNKSSHTRYKQTHNSCFRGQSREKLTAQSFFHISDNPGPGEYENKSQFLQRKAKSSFQKNEKQQQQGEVNSHSIQKLKKRIEQAVCTNDIKIIPQNENIDKIIVNALKTNQPSHMFIADQRDRFGENQYINFFSSKNPMYSPGPGQYQQMHKTIQNQQQKIEKIKDQRKLLKEWLNPKRAFQQDDSTIISNIQDAYTPDPLCVYQFSYN